MANGKAGAAKGNRNAAKGHMMRNALIKAVKIRSGIKVALGGTEDFQALIDMADAQITNAIAGDCQAFNAIADRLDGKPGQAIAIEASENVTFNLNYVATPNQ